MHRGYGRGRIDDHTAILQVSPKLFQAVSQEIQEPHHVLIHYEHCNATQGTATLPPRQLPVDPPDPEGVPEADLYLLPPDGNQVPLPYPPDPACLQPLWELLWLGHVALHVAGH